MSQRVGTDYCTYTSQGKLRSYPFRLAPCKFGPPEQNPEISFQANAGHQENPGRRGGPVNGGSPTDASCSGRQQPSWAIDSRGSTTRTVWENIQRLHIRTSPLPPSKDTSTNNPYHSTHFQFNLCCIISENCDVPIFSLPRLLGALCLSVQIHVMLKKKIRERAASYRHLLKTLKFSIQGHNK